MVYSQLIWLSMKKTGTLLYLGNDIHSSNIYETGMLIHIPKINGVCIFRILGRLPNTCIGVIWEGKGWGLTLWMAPLRAIVTQYKALILVDTLDIHNRWHVNLIKTQEYCSISMVVVLLYIDRPSVPISYIIWVTDIEISDVRITYLVKRMFHH